MNYVMYVDVLMYENVKPKLDLRLLLSCCGYMFPCRLTPVSVRKKPFPVACKLFFLFA